MSDYDCVLRQREEGFLRLNLDFLIVSLELIYWDP